MACDLANESARLVKVHPLEVRLIAREDLVGLRDHPDLTKETESVNRAIFQASQLLDSIPRSSHLQSRVAEGIGPVCVCKGPGRQ